MSCVLLIEVCFLVNQHACLLLLRCHVCVVIHVRSEVKSTSRVTRCKNFCPDRNVHSFGTLCDSFESLVLARYVDEDSVVSFQTVPANLEVSWHVVLVSLLSKLLEVGFDIDTSSERNNALTIVTPLCYICEWFILSAVRLEC